MNSVAKHPAPFSLELLPEIASLLAEHDSGPRLLDPFAGTGRIHHLRPCGFQTVGIEIEPEWALQSPYTLVGDATSLPFADDSFDGAVSSPCLEQGQRVLTEDLRWVSVGSVQVGDRLLAFDEAGPGLTSRGMSARRRWRRAEVVRSIPRRVECVRVILANGDEVVTTPEHPWLTARYNYGGRHPEWVQSKDLMGFQPEAGKGRGRGWQKGRRIACSVFRQTDTWSQRTSFDAGWLSGLFDGEGSLSLGVHGAPKLLVYQVLGPVLDRAEALMGEFGYEPNRILRAPQGPNRQPVGNLYVTGGFPGIMKALGELRPTRLMRKWLELDMSSRTIQAERVQVLAVEPAGVRDIQEIETSEGTYIGEGYLMHNCYANRMADSHVARDASHRRTYTHYLGRPLASNSAGRLQWGAQYRDLHELAWAEVRRVVVPNGLFVLNCKDHIRAGKRQHVTNWHYQALLRLGFELVDVRRVVTPHFKFGANRDARLPERLLVFRNSAKSFSTRDDNAFHSTRTAA